MRFAHQYGLSKASGHRKTMNIRDTLGGADAEHPKSIGLSDAPRCMAACQEEFTKGLGIDPTGNPAVIQKQLCQKIHDDALNPWLQDLYCCDIQYCGLHLLGNGFGLDPNVKGVVGQCSSLGITNITDPGPPAPGECGSGDGNPFKLVEVPPDAPVHHGFTMQIETAVESRTSSAQSAISTGITSPTDAGGLATTTSAPPGVGPDLSSDRFNAGGKVAVGICAGVAALTLLLALSCLRKRLSRRSRQYLKTKPNTRTLIAYEQTPGSSHASLIAPSASCSQSCSSQYPQPLTPPMRLSDRRFLSSVLGPTPPRSSSAPALHSGQVELELAFPKHPIFSPTTTRLLPRQERHTTPLEEHGEKSDSASLRNSGLRTVSPSRAVSSARTNSLTSGDVTNAAVAGTPPLSPSPSPSRPQRPHDSPLQIPGLITPAGPPPERALPSPPPHVVSFQLSPTNNMSVRSPRKYPILPVSPVSPMSPPSSKMPSAVPGQTHRPVSPLLTPGEIGLAICGLHGTQEASSGVMLQSLSHGSRRGGNDHNRRGSRESWGSWSEPGYDGGRPVVVERDSIKGEGRPSMQHQGDKTDTRASLLKGVGLTTNQRRS